MTGVRLSVVVGFIALVGCTERPKFKGPVDAGPVCDEAERLVNGQCRFVCDRDGDCNAGERCNLLTGVCVPKRLRPATPARGRRARCARRRTATA
jgi:hypothetical protein